MAELTRYIEVFVDVSNSLSLQAASLDSIVSLVKKEVTTIEKLVIEMQLYLTTTDNIIRARGILLLAEVIKGLESKQLDIATIHSLIGFFAEKLADWRTLNGALLGCLALLKRKGSVGVVSAIDAHLVGKSYLQNLQVQSLGQSERKLCFELLECLVTHYPQSIAQLGEVLVYGACEAMDGERDPNCLMLAFHIVEGLAKVFPDPCGPLGTYAADIFEVLGCYFPLHFTHLKGEDVDVKRDELSRALMLAFSSTLLFEPFAIPLLLEKLSSSLPIAKVDSLKYLNECAANYGADRMEKHSVVLWSSLKDVIYSSNDIVLTFDLKSFDDHGPQENEIMKEALNLLRNLILQNMSFLTYVIEDADINKIFETITNYPNYEMMPHEMKHELYAASRIISVVTKASASSCNGIFRAFFPCLMDILGISGTTMVEVNSTKDCHTSPSGLSQGALYLCTQLLAGSHCFISSFTHPSSYGFEEETFILMLKNCLAQLINAFVFAATRANEVSHDAEVFLGVKGLQILGKFPGHSLVREAEFERILTTLVAIVTKNFNRMLAWRLSLKALVSIGSSLSDNNEHEKALDYLGVVVEKVVSMASLDTPMHFPLKLEAISEICTSGLIYMSKGVLELKEILYVWLSEVHVHGGVQAASRAIQLLDCFSFKLLPQIVDMGGLVELLFQFAIGIWNHIENLQVFSSQVQEKLLINSAMMSMKLAVSNCPVEIQNTIIQRSYDVLSLSSLPLEYLPQIKVAQETLEPYKISIRDEWILSLFSSVIVAVYPQAHFQNMKSVLRLLILASLMGHVSAAHALGSIVNKLSLRTTLNNSDSSLEEALEIILKLPIVSTNENYCPEVSSGRSNAYEASLMNLSMGVVGDLPLQIHAITALAWIGKGLLMQGHSKLKDITIVFLERIVSECKKDTFQHALPEDNYNHASDHMAKKSAADAFQILMGDTVDCLNHKFHAVVRPLYKQRFFSMMNTILQSSVMKSDSQDSRQLLHRAYAHMVTNTPLIVVLDNAKKLIPMLLDCLSNLSNDIQDRDVLLDLLLVLSGVLTHKNGQEDVLERANGIISCLVNLIGYPHMMRVRETAIQCLIVMGDLPPRRIYPMRAQVLQAVSKRLDDPKRNVRREAVRCRHAWSMS